MTVMASASLDNAIMECTGLTAPDTLTIHIAGYTNMIFTITVLLSAWSFKLSREIMVS